MLTVLTGDAIEQLRTLPAESVQCCVTSPPYWGLRDYGTASWEGGTNGCDHLQTNDTRDPAWCKQTQNAGTSQIGFKESCGKCGAKRIDSQLGLEKTPEEYVAKMVEVFREVRRVLRKDGTLWLNLGDSYFTNPPGRPGNCDGISSNASETGFRDNRPALRRSGLKAKDLIGIPWCVAFALQADGWWLRSDIIWAKPNPMPESVTDRPTKSHEYLFLMTKSASYFYDAEAIKEKSIYYDPKSNGFVFKDARSYDGKHSDKQSGHGRRYAGFNDRRDEAGDLALRNKRSVWTVATAPYPEAHFATYPPDLIKPCIMAGSRVGHTVLDPFAGSGTTGMVALELGRKAILIELNPKYCELIRQRCDITPGLQLA